MLTPKIIVEYQRIPFVYSMGNVRVTFDSAISSIKDVNCMFEQETGKRMVLPNGKLLMEVKYDEYIPDHLAHAIQLTNMQPMTFSKYNSCRKYSL